MDGGAAPGRGWTAERIAEMRRLWATGATCEMIGELLGGLTKSAIAGKARRLELPERRPKLPAAAAVDDSNAGCHARKTRRRGDAPARGALDLPALTGCRFPLWEHQAARPTHQFCGGQPHEPGSSWCADHRAIVFVRAGTADHKKLSSWLAIGPNTPGRRRA